MEAERRAADNEAQLAMARLEEAHQEELLEASEERDVLIVELEKSRAREAVALEASQRDAAMAAAAGEKLADDARRHELDELQRELSERTAELSRAIWSRRR